jgi:Domain of unknown function (DUF1918)/Domain of unknown function (DUF1876)
MNAHVGDELVIRSHQVGRADQRGEIIEVITTGGQHYRVRWSDGRETILFPGPDATVRRAEKGAAPPAGLETRTAVIELRVEEDSEDCEARATLRTSTGVFTGVGTARRNPADPPMPLIGEEFAIARSLADLAAQLEEAARAATSRDESTPRHLVP